MIRTARDEIAKPDILDSEAVRSAMRDASQFYRKPEKTRSQRRYHFPPWYSAPEVRTALTELFNGKCAWCETVIVPVSPVEIVHYRPSAGTIDSEGTFFPDHYWWLTYEWSNLYPACTTCNRYKGHRFPVVGARTDATKRANPSDEEQPLLLDPCADDPAEHLVFDVHTGVVGGSTERGRVTIEILGLNRANLVEERARITQWVVAMLVSNAQGKELIAQLEQATSPAAPYSAMARQAMTQWFKELKKKRQQQFLRLIPSMAQFVLSMTTGIEWNSLTGILEDYEKYRIASDRFSLATKTTKNLYFARSRMIERIEIENFRTLTELDLKIESPEAETAPWLALLGENGTGKSSVLQAIALGLISDSDRNGLALPPDRLLRNRTSQGCVRIHLSGNAKPIEITLRRKGASQVSVSTSNRDPQCLILAYGATRLLPRRGGPKPSTRRFGRVDNLFDPFTPLGDATDWLLKLAPDRFESAARALKDLLSLEDDAAFTRSSETVRLKGYGTSVAVSQLSDGYQSVLALAADIMDVMFREWPDMKVAEGIVLIDELEGHLHPVWKMKIVESLRRTFPRVQFITTTHDPLCLRGLKKGEVAVMRRDEHDLVYAVTDLPPVATLRVEQILTSDYFGLNSTTDPERDRDYRRYYELLTAKRTAVQEDELTELKERLHNDTLLGVTPRDQALLDAVDAYVAERRTTRTPVSTRNKQRSSSDVNAEIARLWARVSLKES